MNEDKKTTEDELKDALSSESLKTLIEVVQKISNLGENDWNNLRKLSEAFK